VPTNFRFNKAMIQLITEFSRIQSKGVRKIRSKQFGCKKRLDFLTVDVRVKRILLYFVSILNISNRGGRDGPGGLKQFQGGHDQPPFYFPRLFDS